MKMMLPLLMFFVFASGCAADRKIVSQASVSTKQGVFYELQASPKSPGSAILAVDLPIKVNKTRFLNRYIKYYDPPYTMVLNIDGQATVLADDPILEDLQEDLRDVPESGKGWRYHFKTLLQLSPGKHHVSIALPLSGVVIEKDLELKRGENILEISPVYIASIRWFGRYPKFQYGVRGLAMKLNDQVL